MRLRLQEILVAGKAPNSIELVAESDSTDCSCLRRVAHNLLGPKTLSNFACTPEEKFLDVGDAMEGLRNKRSSAKQLLLNLCGGFP